MTPTKIPTDVVKTKIPTMRMSNASRSAAPGGTTAPPPSPPSAPPPIPPELSEALDGAAELLNNRARSVERLNQFTDQIPELLQHLIGAQSIAEREKVKSELEQVSVERKGVVAKLLNERTSLATSREEIDRLRLAYTISIREDFDVRYGRVLSELQTLMAEGAALSGCLRSEFKTPPPATISQPWKEALTPSAHPWWRPDASQLLGKIPVLRVDVGAAISPPLPPAVTRIGRTLDLLDKEIELSQAISDYQRRTETFARQTYLSGANFDPNGVYVVAGQMTDLLTGKTFAPGTLIDQHLVPAALLVRAFIAKSIRPVV